MRSTSRPELTMDAPISLHPFEPDLGRLPSLSRAEAAGICVAIAGNVLISLALNCQKLAHRRLEREREQGHQLDQRPYNDLTSASQRIDEEDEANDAIEDSNSARGISAAVEAPVAVVETQPLLSARTANVNTPDYGSGRPPVNGRARSSPSVLARLSPWRKRAAKVSRVEAEQSLLPVDVITVDPGTPRNGDNKGQETPEEPAGNESDYLKSKLWSVTI